MPQKLAYSVPEKWPAQPELVVCEGESVLRISPPPRWLNIVNIIASALFLFSFLPLLFGLWLAVKCLGFSGLFSLVSPVLIVDVAILLAGIIMVSIEICNESRFGNQGTELRATGGELRYRRLGFLRGIRTSIYRADQIRDLRTEATEGWRGNSRMTLHIRIRLRLPIRRVMKTSDPLLPASVENAFRVALGLPRQTDAATLQPKIEQ